MCWISNLFKHKPKDNIMPTVQGAEFWNNKWPTNKVTYKAQGRYPMDIRNLILTKSYILEPTAAKIRDKGNYDQQALAILKFVANRLTYDSDKNVYNLAEYWQNPDISFVRRVGDCEDGGLLIVSLARIVGIPAYRIKLCAGWVQTDEGRGGHAYVIYLADDNEWYVLDWCYWYKASVSNFKKVPHNKQTDKYLDIWWSANDELTWAQKDTII